MIAFHINIRCTSVYVFVCVGVWICWADKFCSFAPPFANAINWHIFYVTYFWLQKTNRVTSTYNTRNSICFAIPFHGNTISFVKRSRSISLSLCVFFSFHFFAVVSTIGTNERTKATTTNSTRSKHLDIETKETLKYFSFALCIHSRSQSFISDSIAMALAEKHLCNLSLSRSNQIVFARLFFRSFFLLLFVIL